MVTTTHQPGAVKSFTLFISAAIAVSAAAIERELAAYERQLGTDVTGAPTEIPGRPTGGVSLILYISALPCLVWRAEVAVTPQWVVDAAVG